MKSIFFLALLFFPALGLADDFDFGEDYEEEQESWSFPFRGTFSSGVGYQIGEPQGLPLLDLSTGLVLDWSGVWGQLAGEGDVKANFSHLLADRSQETIDTYTVVPIFREIYYSYAWAWGSLRAGKFMTVWSSGDLLPLVDVLTAQDLTQSFFAKPDQIRIGQVGMRFDFYFENHTINVLWHGWPQSSRFVDGDHPYSFLSVPCTDVGEPKTSSWPDCKREGAVMAGLQLPIGEIWDPTEFALRWNYKGQALSFSVQGGRVFSRNPSIGFEVSGVSEIEGAPPVLSARFSPYYFGAITYTHVLGALLFKTEVMGTLDEPTPIFSGQVPETVPKDGIKAMVGLDYTHEDWGSFLVECSIDRRGESGWNSPARTMLYGAVAWNHRFWRDQVSLSLVAMVQDAWDNHIMRAGLDYQLLDDLTLSTQGTYLAFSQPDKDGGDPGSSSFPPQMNDWDRIDFSVTWSWDLAQ